LRFTRRISYLWCPILDLMHSHVLISAAFALRRPIFQQQAKSFHSKRRCNRNSCCHTSCFADCQPEVGARCFVEKRAPTESKHPTQGKLAFAASRYTRRRGRLLKRHESSILQANGMQCATQDSLPSSFVTVEFPARLIVDGADTMSRLERLLARVKLRTEKWAVVVPGLTQA
jgi:hypothetical protein